MKENEILIIRPQYPVKAETMRDIHKKLIEQAKTGVVLVPFGYEVVIAPKDVEVKMETQLSNWTCMKPDEQSHDYTNEELAKAFNNGRGG